MSASTVAALDEDLELDLRDEVDLVLRPPERLALAALAAEALDLGDGEAEGAAGLEGVLHLLELVRLDHRGDELDLMELLEWSGTDGRGCDRSAGTG